jgi:hypothetical protein
VQPRQTSAAAAAATSLQRADQLLNTPGSVQPHQAAAAAATSLQRADQLLNTPGSVQPRQAAAATSLQLADQLLNTPVSCEFRPTVAASPHVNGTSPAYLLPPVSYHQFSIGRSNTGSTSSNKDSSIEIMTGSSKGSSDTNNYSSGGNIKNSSGRRINRINIITGNVNKSDKNGIKTNDRMNSNVSIRSKVSDGMNSNSSNDNAHNNSGAVWGYLPGAAMTQQVVPDSADVIMSADDHVALNAAPTIQLSSDEVPEPEDQNDTGDWIRV